MLGGREKVTKGGDREGQREIERNYREYQNLLTFSLTLSTFSQYFLKFLRHFLTSQQLSTFLRYLRTTKIYLLLRYWRVQNILKCRLTF